MNVTAWVPAEDPDRVYLRTPFELKDAVKAIPGARWNKVAKVWTIPALPSAAGAMFERLTGNTIKVDPAVEELLKQYVAEQDHVAVKELGDDELAEIPGRLPAWLHQKRGYHFAFPRKGTMLAMDMGTGKSRTTVSLLDGWGSMVAVILCPRSVVGVWPNQFATHSEREWRVVVPPGSATVSKRASFITREVAQALTAKKPVAIVVNYEAFWRPVMKELIEDLARRGVLVLDESHRIKSASGKASKQAGKLGGLAQRILALTGTPMPHSPLDVYGQMRAVDPGLFGTSFLRFRSRYAIMGGYEQRQVIGYQNVEELTTKLGQASFVVKKDEAGLDLPDVVHVQRPFVLERRSLKAYQTIDADFVLGVGDGTVTTANALTKLLRLQQVTSGYVRDDDGEDHEVGNEKIDVLDDVLEDLATDEPIVIFARFKHDLQLIRALCEKQGRRFGEVSGDVKPGSPDYGLNEHSQMRDDLDVVALQIQSGGVGIDLTRAAYAVYYSLDFSLGNFEQSLARLDRPGQKRKVTYFHLVAKGTKDEVVYRALQERKDVVEAVIAASRGKQGTDNNEEATAA